MVHSWIAGDFAGHSRWPTPPVPLELMSSLPQRFAATRIAVAFLGQAGAAGWWNSSFLSANGLAVAQYNFPRAPQYASINATTAAAKRLHDERIGKRRCVHLFRLSLGDEMLIQRALQDLGGRPPGTLPANPEEALRLLETEGGEIISVEAGPVQVGNIADAFTEAGLNELAKHYLAAFRQKIQCLPYFASVKK